MAHPKNRFLLLIVAAAATVSGCQRERIQTRGGATPTLYRVVVGPTAAQVDPEELTINNSIDGKPSDEVFWILVDAQHKLDANRKLFIEFEKAEPFPENTPHGNRFQMQCSGGYCQSGKVGPKASGTYTYHQSIVETDGTTTTVDGRIIIKP